MSKPDQTPARAVASSSKAQADAVTNKGQKGPSLSQSLAFLLLLSPLNSTQREDGDESVEQLEIADEIGETDEGDEEGSTAERHDNDGKEENLIKALRGMGIKAPKHLDSKRDRNFETWLKRTEFLLEVIKCPVEDRTNALILLLDGD